MNGEYIMHTSIRIENIQRISRPKIGYVYRGQIYIGDLAHQLNEATILYAPKYQRGLKDTESDIKEFNKLYKIDDKSLAINSKRSQSMAVKFLIGLSSKDNDNSTTLFSSDIIWNVRVEDHPSFKAPVYDKERAELTIYSKITIPDSGHRHYAYWTLCEWKNNSESIPQKVDYEDNGASVSAAEIEKLLGKFDPYGEHSQLFTTIYHLKSNQEGDMFDEFNDEQKKAGTARSIAMSPNKTPPRRIVHKLMLNSEILSEDEIQISSNSISSKSRKLTTNATLVAAFKPFSKRLLELEDSSNKIHYDDLINFYVDYFDEWSEHFPMMKPEKPTAGERNKFRQKSFAISNIIFFPLIHIAYDIWEALRKQGIDWKTDKTWRDSLAKLAGKTTAGDGNSYPIMSRNNVDWNGKIVIQVFDKDGKPSGWNLSSTSSTRKAAYHYMIEKSGLKDSILAEN
jgi:hypothetical protein